MSWQQLLDIYREQDEEAAAEAMREPSACPNDGEPLRTDAAGELVCPFDGWPNL